VLAAYLDQNAFTTLWLPISRLCKILLELHMRSAIIGVSYTTRFQPREMQSALPTDFSVAALANHTAMMLRVVRGAQTPRTLSPIMTIPDTRPFQPCEMLPDLPTYVNLAALVDRTAMQLRVHRGA
jgi:hypothetical protein